MFPIHLQVQHSLWRGSERLNLLRRQARNLLLLTLWFYAKSIPSKDQKRSLHVVTKKEHKYFHASFSGKWKLRWHNVLYEQDNDWVHNSKIYSVRIKITARKFMCPSLDETINKRVCFLSFWLYKNDKNARIIPFVQLHVSIGNGPKVVRFIARRPVCFVRPTWRKVKSSTVWYHKLLKYNLYHYSNEICTFLKRFLLKYLVQFHCERPQFNCKSLVCNQLVRFSDET